jgi:hypothetical protein
MAAKLRIELFYLGAGRYPTSSEGLDALVPAAVRRLRLPRILGILNTPVKRSCAVSASG